LLHLGEARSVAGGASDFCNWLFIALQKIRAPKGEDHRSSEWLSPLPEPDSKLIDSLLILLNGRFAPKSSRAPIRGVFAWASLQI
jgi:hypothetical protein